MPVLFSRVVVKHLYRNDCYPEQEYAPDEREREDRLPGLTYFAKIMISQLCKPDNYIRRKGMIGKN